MILPIDLVVENESCELEDKSTVGEELASLGEFAKNKGRILPRIILTPYAFTNFLEENNLITHIKHLLGSINHDHHDSLAQISSYIQKAISTGAVPSKITKPLFAKLKKEKEWHLEAYYFQGRTQIGVTRSKPLKGESVIAENIRFLWAQLFTVDNLKKYMISHNNHHEFFVCIAVVPNYKYQLQGHVKTFGAKKAEYEIEAHTHVRFFYHKHEKALIRGHLMRGGNKNALGVAQIRILLEYAKLSEKVFFMPKELRWGMHDEALYVTHITHISSYIEHENSYDFLTKSMTVTPGITIGRLNVINEKENSVFVSQDEIVLLKKIDKKMIETVKKAKGIIVESNPHPEIVALLKNMGIPAVIRKQERLLYSTGDIISLNATTGEIKRGSILVS